MVKTKYWCVVPGERDRAGSWESQHLPRLEGGLHWHLSEATLSLVKRRHPNSNSTLWMSPHAWEQSLSPQTLQQELLLPEPANSALVNLLPWPQQILGFPQQREKISLDKHVSTFDFKWLIWAKTEKKIMDLAYFHDILMMTLPS